MTHKEPADWAKIKAYRVYYPRTTRGDQDVLRVWAGNEPLPAMRELARMYDLTEKPPVDPDLLAAREWADKRVMPAGGPTWDLAVRGFLAGIKHGRANP